MVSQIESPSLIVASFSILLLLLSSLATTMASTTEAATASTSSHTQKKEHGKETFFFSLPLLKLLLAGRRVFRCCRRRRAAKRRVSWLAWPLGLSLGLGLRHGSGCGARSTGIERHWASHASRFAAKWARSVRSTGRRRLRAPRPRQQAGVRRTRYQPSGFAFAGEAWRWCAR